MGFIYIAKLSSLLKKSLSARSAPLSPFRQSQKLNNRIMRYECTPSGHSL